MYMVKERLIQSVLVCAVNELTRNSPLLKGGQKKAAKLSGAEDACQFDSGRDAPSACKFFILDVSEIANELGLPVCNEVSTPSQPTKRIVHETRCLDARRHLCSSARSLCASSMAPQAREERLHV